MAKASRSAFARSSPRWTRTRGNAEGRLRCPVSPDRTCVSSVVMLSSSIVGFQSRCGQASGIDSGQRSLAPNSYPVRSGSPPIQSCAVGPGEQGPIMRAMVLAEPRKPLSYRDLPERDPAPGEVVVKVHACGVCRTDLHVVDGELPHPRLPLVPGHEIVGEVA